MVQTEQVVNDEIVDEDACHFEIIDGEGVVVHAVHDVLGPFHPPHQGVDGLCARGPDAPGAKLAGVGVANEGGFAGDELGALGWSVSNDFEHGLEVDNGSSLGGVGVDANGGLVGLGAAAACDGVGRGGLFSRGWCGMHVDICPGKI